MNILLLIACFIIAGAIYSGTYCFIRWELDRTFQKYFPRIWEEQRKIEEERRKK